MKDEHATAIVDMLASINTNLMSISASIQIVATQLKANDLSQHSRELERQIAELSNPPTNLEGKQGTS